MRRPSSAGGLAAILYVLRSSRRAGGLWHMWRAMRRSNACKTCALGMGGQLGGMVNERGHFPEVCKKSIQAMAADMQGRIPERFFDDFSLDRLRGFSPRELEHAGRIVEPVIAGPLDMNYRPISWSEAMERIAAKLRDIDPTEAFLYLSGRSSNEAAFLAQLFARVYGTGHVSNCSFYCHQASGVALAETTGSSTATVTLEDLEHTELLFLIGGNPASNHPRLMSTLVKLRRRGGSVIVINPMRELGLERFRVPSDARSMLFGSTIADEYLQPHIGGDIAVLAGIGKAILELGAEDSAYLESFTNGSAQVVDLMRSLAWEHIELMGGVARGDIERVAQRYAKAKSAVFAWTMGITHHLHGTDNVRMIANLALLRGMVGRRHSGLLPLRGHSNVQGVGSMGVAPKIKDELLNRLTERFGVVPPRTAGVDTIGALELARRGELKAGVCLGGNLYGATPDATFAAESLTKLDLLVYVSTTLNTGHAMGRARETIILPALVRDEEAQRTTQESMFNYVRVSDGGPPRHDGPRSEVEIIVELAERVLGARTTTDEAALDWSRLRDHDAIREVIAEMIPGYGQIAEAARTGTEFSIPGRTFHEPTFKTSDGRAKMSVMTIPEPPAARGELALMTIRSEGQFNTVVYDLDDRYRGQERRDIIMMAADDIARLGLRVDQRVRVASEVGALSNVLVREIPIRAGNCAMYCPEANVLVPRAIDPHSRTPAFKCVTVMVTADDSSRNGFNPFASVGSSPDAGTARRERAC